MQDNGRLIGDIESLLQYIHNNFSETNFCLQDSVVTNIRNEAFRDRNKIRTINLPNVKTLGNYVFRSCKCHKIYLPSFESGDTANDGYRDCTRLVFIDHGKRTVLNDGTFRNTPCLSGIVLRNNSVVTLKVAFNESSRYQKTSNVPGEAYVYVPRNLISEYQIATNWVTLYTKNAIILVILSVILTLIGGLIPAKAASKKDPVIALRTE